MAIVVETYNQVVDKIITNVITNYKEQAIYNKYMIDIELPNNIELKDVTVCESEIGTQKLDLIIGMNIINKGDFAISNFNGMTKFLFRIPTSSDINL